MSQNSKSIITCVLYRPPNSSKQLSKSFLETFDKQLSNIIRENKEVIIVGDINFNYLDESNGNQFKDILSLNGFAQVVNDPTRIIPNSETLIDVILTSKQENVCDIKIIPTAISDHDAVGCRRNIKKKVRRRLSDALITQITSQNACAKIYLLKHFTLYILQII